MEKQRKKQIKTIITWAALALLVVTLAVMPLVAEEAVIEDGPQASMLSATARNRTIETQLIGGGQLSSSATEHLTIPAEVKLKEYLVGNGDTVSKGQPIARVDQVSVQSALAKVQETLDYLDGKLTDAAKKSNEDTVKAHAGGLVKIIYGQPGDSARDVMLAHGALAVLSLDGRMAVDLELSTGLKTGTGVCLVLADGREVKGKVEASAGGTLTVSVQDEGYAVGETVAVQTGDGEHLGSGELYIHNAWNATAYHGTVSRVHVKEGDNVTAGKKLFSLDVGDYSDQFQILTAQRKDYEELMRELFTLYDSGVVSAPCDGLVTGVDKDGAFLLSAEAQGWVIQLLSNDLPPEEGGDPDPSPDPNPDPDPNPGTCTGQIGCTAQVHNPGCPGEVPAAPTVVSTVVGRVEDAAAGTVSVMGGGTETWDLSQVFASDMTTPHPNPIAVGDTLYQLTLSDGTRKIVFGSSGTPAPGMGQMPDLGGMMAGMMGGMMGGMYSPAPAFEPYPLEEITIASVTSQEKMTLEITVDEQDIRSIAPGQQATVTVEAVTGQRFPAEVASIGNMGASSGGSSKFTAKLTLGKSGQMLPGMNASAYLTMEIREDVLAVPVAALTELEGRTVVHTGYDEKHDVLTSPVEVATGLSDGEFVQILSGLSEGDTVWYAYYDTPEISNVPENFLGF